MGRIENRGVTMELNRRQMIGWGAGGAIAGATTPWATAVGRPSDAGEALIPALAPGLSYATIGKYEFFPDDAAAGRIVTQSDGTYGANATAWFYGRVPVPVGARLREITVWLRTKTAADASIAGPEFVLAPADGGLFNVEAGFDPLDASTEIQVRTRPLDRTVRAGETYLVRTRLRQGPEAQVVGAMVGFLGAPLFRPIVPARVYDSRKDNAPTPNGSLASGADRTVPVADGRDVDTNAVNDANVVPAGSTAIAFTLTVANTTGSGFLSVTPGDAGELGASTINWGPGTSGALANSGIVQLDGDRQIKVFAGGGGSTDFIVDVTGFYL